MLFLGCKDALKYVHIALTDYYCYSCFCCSNLQRSKVMAVEKTWKTRGIFFSYFVATLCNVVKWQ